MCKQLNKPSLIKWFSVRLRAKCLWAGIPLQSLKIQISRLFRARISLTLRQLQSQGCQVQRKKMRDNELFRKDPPSLLSPEGLHGCASVEGLQKCSKLRALAGKCIIKIIT